MTATLAHIWRHPIKSHGAEVIDRATLTAGQGLPGDRVWAVIHANSPVDPVAPEWAASRAFVIGTDVLPLVAIRAQTLADGRITLHHPDLADITLDMTQKADQARLIAWTAPLMETGRPAATAVIRLASQGVFDTPFPSISLNNTASLAELSAVAGHNLDMRRFRGNFWFSDLPAWQEHDWIGRKVRFGTAHLLIRAPVQRCAATTVNPQSGTPDVETPYLLRKHWGHRDFGVYAQVIKSGEVALGDRLELI